MSVSQKQEQRETITPGTSLPWRINPGAADGGDDAIENEHGEFVVDCYAGDLDGRYIVHACNLYPELLAACKLALNAFERNDAIDWSVLEAAIAKAEGR